MTTMERGWRRTEVLCVLFPLTPIIVNRQESPMRSRWSMRSKLNGMIRSSAPKGCPSTEDSRSLVVLTKDARFSMRERWTPKRRQPREVTRGVKRQHQPSKNDNEWLTTKRKADAVMSAKVRRKSNEAHRYC